MSAAGDGKRPGGASRAAWWLLALAVLLLAAAFTFALGQSRAAERLQGELDAARAEAEGLRGELAAVQGELGDVRAARDEALSAAADSEQARDDALSTLQEMRDFPESYDQTVNSILHRGWATEAPENTLPAFRLGREKGFSYMEADVSFTADGHPVLLHDKKVDRTSNGEGEIEKLTLREVRQLDFGAWKGEEYAGTKIPTFEEFISLCRDIGIRPYIEIKPDCSAEPWRVRALADTVRRYGMEDRVTWISFQYVDLVILRDYVPTARLGLLVGTIDDAQIEQAASLRTGSNSVFLDSRSFTEDEVLKCRWAKIPLEVYVLDTTEQIVRLDPYISGVTSNFLNAGKILYESRTSG